VVGAVLAGGAILAEVIVVVGLTAGGFLSSAQPVSRSFGSPEAIGRLFLTDHLLAFEVTSIVAPRGGGRRRRARIARPYVRHSRGRRCTGLTSRWYVILAALLFTTGALGVMLRRSPLIILLSIEIMLNSANLLLIAFSRLHGREDGQIFAISVMAIAASEVVVGLGLIVAMGRRNLELDVDKLRTLRG